jgi:hypothetical protein
MIAMFKLFRGSICLFVLLALQKDVVAQPKPSSKNSAAFCKNDRRFEIRVYCTALARFQSAVNDGTVATPDQASGYISKLDLSDPDGVVDFITAAATKSALSSALRDAGQARPDRQLSATSNASGTTSLVSKAGSAELISLALDAGVLTRTVNGTTATLNTNADQILRLVTGSDPDCTVTCNRLGWFEDKVLNPTNIAASFDLAQQSNKITATSGQASGSTPIQISNVAIPNGARKLSGITARYQLRNKFDPRSPAFLENWKQAVSGDSALKEAAIGVAKATEVVRPMVNGAAPTLNPEEVFRVTKTDPTGKALVDYFADYYSRAANAVVQNQKLAPAVSQVIHDRAIYRNLWNKALDKAVGTLLTFEYNYNRPLHQPMTHDVKLIYGYNFQTMGMVTFNGAVSLYGGAIPAAAKYGRVHYGQVSAEYDRTVSGKDKAVQTQLSLAGYWQYQPSPSILNIPAGTVVPGTTIPLPNGTQEFVGTAGSLWVTQFKLTIKGAGGINIPIGVSWSNKTDLLQGSKVGAQIGISYNFSSLAGLFSGGSQ